MGFFLVLKAETVRAFITMRRYWFATLTAMLVGYTMFGALIFGFVSGAVDMSRWASYATDKTFGFVIGMFAFSIVGMFSNGLAGMARSGELEQVYMSPHGLITNFLARSFVSTITSIIVWTIMLMLVAAAFNQSAKRARLAQDEQLVHAQSVEAGPGDGGAAQAAPAASAMDRAELHYDPLPITLLLLLTYFNMVGFGFMVGGLVLVFKQIGQFAVLVRFAMMAIAFTASEKIYELPVLLQWIAHGIPITDAAICLKLVVLHGYGSDIVGHTSFYFLIANVLIWTPIGLSCFKFMENWARDKGTLGAF